LLIPADKKKKKKNQEVPALSERYKKPRKAKRCKPHNKLTKQ